MFDILAGVLGGAPAGQIANQVGADSSTVQQVIAMGLPLLISALSRNASTQQGAESLTNALQKDHDGSVLGNLPGYVAKPDIQDGEAILGHVLGGQLGDAQAGISKASGLNPEVVGKILAMLAPVVLGYLGQQVRSNQLDASGVGNMVRQEEQYIEKQPPSELGQLLGVFLDQNQDGSVADDAANVGMKMLQSWLLGGGSR